MATVAPIAITKNGFDAHSPFNAAPSPVTPVAAVVEAVPTDVMPRACLAAEDEPKFIARAATFSFCVRLVNDIIEACAESSKPLNAFAIELIPSPFLLSVKTSPIVFNCLILNYNI